MQSPTRLNRRRKIAVFVYPNVASVDVCGPLEPFGLANFLTGQRLYKPMTVSVDGASVPVAGGFLKIEPTCGCADLPERVDLLLVAGGPGYMAAAEDNIIQSWLRRLEPRCERMGAICTGATVLHASGVLKGQRIATHWVEAQRLCSDANANVVVEEDSIFVQSGKFWTSAGMLAGVDLALALIEADHGRQLALDIARFMVMVLRRQGGQSQFSTALKAETTEDPRVRRVQLAIYENPDASLSLKILANMAAMSERSLVRRFKELTGKTISSYTEDVRLDLACRLLETSNLSMKSVAAKSGFGTAATMRRVFARRLSTSPSQYKANFGILEGKQSIEKEREDSLKMDLKKVISGKSVW
ncbi:GlxA family transcriptional regulator [Roseovarius aestuariivivens]|uniref:GlxA family transcriptional regulator n=1 Tax=Roseovarius aestuariivivens TaxID=1888910 RepID=UPI00108123E8|nr:helix-turn-helix domain-containing protein [Roseovarius aestuariivivens]